MILKELRQQKNLTQLELSKLLGIDRAMLSLYESGKIKSIPYHNILKIADFFEVSIDDLMERRQRLFKVDRFNAKQLDLIDEIQKLNDEQVANVMGYVSALKGVGLKNYDLTDTQVALLNSVRNLTDREIARVSGYAEAISKNESFRKIFNQQEG